MQDDLQLSIIVPHKDSPEFLERLLNTIPDDEDIEVLIVDDHSNHPPDISTFHRSNVKLIPNLPARAGAGSARNTALEQAKGAWILFADADDWFLPEAFQTIRTHLEDPADIIYFRPEAQHESPDVTATRHLAYVSLVEEFVQGHGEWIRYRFHPPWSKLIRRNLLQKHHIRFDESPLGDDVMFSLKIGVEAQTVNAVNTPIYCVRQGNPNALTSRLNEQVVDARLDIHCRYNQLLREQGLWKYRLTVLPILRKAWRVSPGKFVSVLAYCIYNRQPIFDNWRHMRMLWQQRNGVHANKRSAQN